MSANSNHIKASILQESLFKSIDSDTALHFPRYEFAKTVFDAVEANREYLGKWLSWVAHSTEVKHTYNFIGESLKYLEGGQRLPTFIFYRQQFAGSIGFVRINKAHRKGEIGYWLKADLQGKGIMTKACRTIIQHAFEELQLHRIEIRALSENLPSRAIPERLGFQQEAILRQDIFQNEKFNDTIIYGLLNTTEDHKTEFPQIL
ncbi:MAG: GNAT family protein [Bacteroidota bacterium]